MRFRKLRIAFSVACGMAILLLVVLWVRSYWRIDWLSYLSSISYANVASARGCVGFWYDSPPPANVSALVAKGWQFNISPAPSGIAFGSGWNWTPSVNTVWVPYWLIVAACVAFGFAPWLRWSKQFSLRTLLIATTVVAIVLGLIVALGR